MMELGARIGRGIIVKVIRGRSGKHLRIHDRLEYGIEHAAKKCTSGAVYALYGFYVWKSWDV